MKKLVTIILTVISLIALYYFIRLSSFPLITENSKILQKLFLSTAAEKDKYSQINNLSTGILASMIFYLIVQVIPNLIQVNRAKRIVSYYIFRILSNMEIVLLLTCEIYGINVPMEKLREEDMAVISKNISKIHNEVNFDRVTYKDKDKEEMQRVRHNRTFLDEIRQALTEIVRNIGRMKEFEYIYSVNSELVEIIRRIDNCSFIKDYKDNLPCYLGMNADKTFFEFKRLYDLLRKQHWHNLHTKIGFVNDENNKTIS